MSITLEQATSYIGASDYDTDEILRILTVANTIVERAIEDAWRPVPEVIEDEAVLRTTASLWALRRSTDTGNLLGAAGSGVQVVANDPMRKSWDLLKPYLNRV